MLDKDYGNFKLIDITPLPEYNSTGLFLVHEKTGLEVFHILNDDHDCLFAFSFKTHPQDNTGVAHILEHTVLCGSKNFPLKDPFMQLNKQSIKTYLNAWTTPDKTIYLASSTVEKDYFNLMWVYGDCVFFPLLNENAFRQEGHRLDYDKDGNLVMQGVVYNEMKGAMADPHRQKISRLDEILYKDTIYAYNSGGDPRNIPELTYENFCKYHKEHYSPNNCKLFLYGNIPTEKQLDFIEEKFLKPYLEENNDYSKTININEKNLCQGLKDKTNLVPKPLTETYSENFGIYSAKENDVILAWHLGDFVDNYNILRNKIISIFLIRHDGSPLSKDLLESGLGHGLSVGLMGEKVFVAGMENVAEENIEKIKETVLKSLEKLANNTIEMEDFDSTIRYVESQELEQATKPGIFSRSLMTRTLTGWYLNLHPTTVLKIKESIEKIKAEVAEEGEKWIQRTIRELFLENKNRCFINFYPDEDIVKKNAAIEEENIHKAFAQYGEEAKSIILAKNKQLQDYQNALEDDNTKNLIPCLSKKDLKREFNDKSTLQEKNIGNVKILFSPQNTNVFNYVRFQIPLDVLSPDDIIYIPLYTAVISNIGFAGMSWAEAACVVSNINCHFDVNEVFDDISDFYLYKHNIANLKDEALTESLFSLDPIIDRKWISYQSNSMIDKIEDAIKVLFQCYNSPDFSDETRIWDLFKQYKNEILMRYQRDANVFASIRSYCHFSKDSVFPELFNGVSQLNVLREVSTWTPSLLCKKMEEIYNKLKGHGAILKIVCEEENYSKIEKLLEPYLKDFPVLAKPYLCKDEEYYEKVIIKDKSFFQQKNSEKNDGAEKTLSSDKEFFKIDSAAGFAVSSFKVPNLYLNNDSRRIHAILAENLLTQGVLWEQLREVGGSYGCCFWSSEAGIAQISTYRDPNPIHSLDVFEKIFTELESIEIDPDVFEKLVISTYGELIAPRSPFVKGIKKINQRLCGYSFDWEEKKIGYLLDTAIEDIKDILKDISAAISNRKSVVFFNNFEKNSGKIENFEL